MTARQILICTKEHPWNHDTGNAVIQHPDATEGKQHDGWPSGDYVEMHCPNCNHRWQMELPQ